MATAPQPEWLARPNLMIAIVGPLAPRPTQRGLCRRVRAPAPILPSLAHGRLCINLWVTRGQLAGYRLFQLPVLNLELLQAPQLADLETSYTFFQP